MALETVRPRNPAGHAGFFAALIALCSDLAALAESRFALLAKESKAVLMQMLVLAACVVAALTFLIFGYIFLVISAIVALAHIIQVSWTWVALGAAAIHFLFAVVALLVARSRMIKRPFPELSSELKKDREWLKNLDASSRPTI